MPRNHYKGEGEYSINDVPLFALKLYLSIFSSINLGTNIVWLFRLYPEDGNVVGLNWWVIRILDISGVGGAIEVLVAKKIVWSNIIDTKNWKLVHNIYLYNQYQLTLELSRRSETKISKKLLHIFYILLEFH